MICKKHTVICLEYKTLDIFNALKNHTNLTEIKNLYIPYLIKQFEFTTKFPKIRFETNLRSIWKRKR